MVGVRVGVRDRGTGRVGLEVKSRENKEEDTVKLHEGKWPRSSEVEGDGGGCTP